MTDANTEHLAKDVKALAGLLATSGAIHLVKPEVYEPIMPRAVPAKRAVIYGSGVVELVCAAGLLHPRTRRAAGWLSTGLLLAVYPANVKMAVDAQRGHNVALRGASLARLPLQFPMVWTAYRTARGR